MIAVFVNCLSIIIGSILGLLFSKKISESLLEMIKIGSGVIVLILGIQMGFKFHNIIFLTLSIVLGGIVGCVADIDGKILGFGTFLQRLCIKNNENISNNFSFAFLNSSVLFCVGAMSIVGSFKAGVEKDYSIIFTKSILDGFMSISFASAMGVGTAFSALTVLIYQGGLTLLSQLFASKINPEMLTLLVDELTGVGGVIIIMIGINLLKVKEIKTADFLPSFIFEILFIIIVPFVKNLIG